MIIFIIIILVLLFGFGIYKITTTKKNDDEQNSSKNIINQRNCFKSTECKYFLKKNAESGLYERCIAHQTGSNDKKCSPCGKNKRGPNCEYYTTRKQCNMNGTPGETFETWGECTCDKIPGSQIFKYMGDKCQYESPACVIENTKKVKLNQNEIECVCKPNFYGYKCENKITS